MAGPLLAVQVGMGEQILILTFVVVVIGGVGSIRGAFYGALIVGIIDTMLRAFLPGLLRRHGRRPEADALGAGLSSMGIYLADGARAADPAEGAVPCSRSERAIRSRSRSRAAADLGWPIAAAIVFVAALIAFPFVAKAIGDPSLIGACDAHC